MRINVGDHIPDADLYKLGAQGAETIKLHSLLAGKKIALFGVPGAYTPTCMNSHIPSFLHQYEGFMAKGYAQILCIAVNDVFVLDHWANSCGMKDKITLLSDGNAEFTKALGLELDARGMGLGIRSNRYAMLLDDGKITHLVVEENPTKVTITNGEKVLAHA